MHPSSAQVSSAGTEYGSGSDACASALELQQQRQQTYRELPLYSRSMKPGWSWRTLTRTRTLCQLLAGLVALTVIFHAASCGFFFCVRFPRALEFPHDMYHDIRDIYILAGMLLHIQLSCHKHITQGGGLLMPGMMQM